MLSDLQIQKLHREYSVSGNCTLASRRSDMCRHSGAKYLKLKKLPSQLKQQRNYLTRADPFDKVDAQIDEVLEQMPGICATQMLAYLQLKHEGCFSAAQLRTLQRRLKIKRARSHTKEQYFRQQHLFMATLKKIKFPKMMS